MAIAIRVGLAALMCSALAGSSNAFFNFSGCRSMGNSAEACKCAEEAYEEIFRSELSASTYEIARQHANDAAALRRLLSKDEQMKVGELNLMVAEFVVKHCDLKSN